MEDLICALVEEYMNDNEFIYTISIINNSIVINDRRKQILSKRSASSLYTILLDVRREYNLYESLHETTYCNKKKMDIYFDLLDDIQNELLRNTSIHQVYRSCRHIDNEDMLVKYVHYNYARSILQTPLNKVRKHFNELGHGEIGYSYYICSIYRLKPFERRILNKYPNVKALIY